jgi:hypothetical protein
MSLTGTLRSYVSADDKNHRDYTIQLQRSGITSLKMSAQDIDLSTFGLEDKMSPESFITTAHGLDPNHLDDCKDALTEIQDRLDNHSPTDWHFHKELPRSSSA